MTLLVCISSEYLSSASNQIRELWAKLVLWSKSLETLDLSLWLSMILDCHLTQLFCLVFILKRNKFINIKWDFFNFLKTAQIRSDKAFSTIVSFVSLTFKSFPSASCTSEICGEYFSEPRVTCQMATFFLSIWKTSDGTHGDGPNYRGDPSTQKCSRVSWKLQQGMVKSPVFGIFRI